MPSLTDILPRVLSSSRYLSRLLTAIPALGDELAAGWDHALTAEELKSFLPGPLDENSLKPALRRFKQRAYLRIATRDLAGLADLDEVTESMTLVAEIALETAQATLAPALTARYGVPRNAKGEAQQLIVVGMGKLGGRELNVSSDIDLIFVYPDDGETDGLAPSNGDAGEAAGDTGNLKRSIDNFEFFTRLGRSLINAIAEATGDGQVFRVDMRLRPNGESGPLVCSFDMLENYFITQGREWERYAWIKARPLMPKHCGERWDVWMAALESMRQLFVFRKYLDFGTINAMRGLHAQIRREVTRQDLADNVKLGPGGIREIEFIAQVFQLIRGGRDTQLQIKPTLKVLVLIVERKQLPLETALELAAAYNFLRRLEHRLQYLDDAQTHKLPDKPADQEVIARAMGFSSYPALLVELDDHRAAVAKHFAAIFADPHEANHALDGVWQASEGDAQTAELSRHGYRDAAEAAQRLGAMRSGSRYQQMPASVRERFDALVPRVIEACAKMPNPDQTLSRSLDLLDAISRRAAYLALLLQYPQALQKVAQLASASSWAAEYLKRHPILLDELLDARILDTAPDWTAFKAQLDVALEAVEPDVELQMDMLRESHHAQLFRLLAQDVSGLLALEKLADHLSELADIMLDLALKFAWRKMAKRHVDTPRFTVISYGKLGGKELGYASDLDLIFLYDDPAPAAQENYARLATRLNTWLSSQTSAGLLFETDLRLRPNGDSGLIVSSVLSFRKYQLEAAWMWEHQALTRARYSAGDREIGSAFEKIRIEILCQHRDLAELRREVLDMRRKMLDNHGGKSSWFDLKHDHGGLIDVEFIVQYLVLGYAHAHHALTGNLGNIALLRIAGELGLIPAALAETVRNAYRDYRRMQHELRLNSQPARVEPGGVAERVAAVRELWRFVFEDQGRILN
ncbi:MAG: bifunctional [glutamate--ammonia ligase]-adenylyl-L-tyrosine phosphorylase/[glutamate--ammonia-ligase] adenylyltransferase [Rhodocyclaceae bacterium]|nr:MAG: bifunctional [glutamate--ammonia ligase]-adenylyl-L-tyrosine phosphorylase/[glutamate--ammonia-ligase] adenylyltransferase [Rhodocyclaceae bacterium]